MSSPPGRSASRGPAPLRRLGVLAAALGCAATPALAQLAKHHAVKVAPQPTLLVRKGSLLAPGREPRGLAFDGRDLWIVDAADNRVYRVDPTRAAGAATPEYPWYSLAVPPQAASPGRPGPAAVETRCDRSGAHCEPVALWVVVDPDARPLAGAARAPTPPPEARIQRFGLVPSSGALAFERTLRVPDEARAGPITGLAWEAASRSLWMAMGGGLCACVYRLDGERGGVTLSFFPRCEPLGIAVSPDSSRLWIVADDGPARPAYLLRRSLTAAKDDLARPISALYTERFYAFQSGLRPTAITAAQSGVWALFADGQVQWFPEE